MQFQPILANCFLIEKEVRAVNRKTALLASLLSMFLLSAMTVPALSQYDWDVGIEIGDWFYYIPTFIVYESENVTFPPPNLEYLQMYDETSWMNYTVTGITPGDGGDVVTFDLVHHWKNGTEITSTVDDNMTSSQSLMVLGANLANYTEIRPEYNISDWPMPARYLNESKILIINAASYTGPREVNVLKHDSNISDQIYHHLYYWDKETGIQVYHEETASYIPAETMGNFCYILKVELLDSALDYIGVLVPEFTGLISLLSSMAITIPLAILIRRRKTIQLK